MSDVRRDFELKRVAAPEGFADRVMARVAQTRVQTEREPWWRALWMRPAFALALLLVMVAGAGYGVQRHEQRKMAALEQAKFAAAMRITSRTLAHVDDEVSRAGLRRKQDVQ